MINEQACLTHYILHYYCHHLYTALEHINMLRFSISKKEKQGSALKHFDVFLMHYYKKEGTKKITTYEEVKLAHLVDTDFLGQFCTYLANHARARFKKDGKLLSLSSAHGYLSSVKGYFQDNFPDCSNFPCFKDRHLASLNNSIYKVPKKCHINYFITSYVKRYVN